MAPVATHERLSRDDDVKIGSNRSFGLVFAAVFAVIGLYPLAAGGTMRWWAAAIAVAFLVAALVKPSLLGPLSRLWFRFGLLLHRIVNPVVMGLIFFAVLTPMALVMRATGRDLLRLRRDPDARTYWIVKEPSGPPPETMDRQF